MRGILVSKTGLILVGFLAVAGYFLWAEHRAHIMGYLPLILVLGLCIGMHFFMHGSHGGHRGHSKDAEIAPNDDDAEHDRRRAP